MAKKYINPNFKKSKSSPIEIKEWVKLIQQGDIVALSRAITLIESEKKLDQSIALELMSALGPPPKDTNRIGITGSPGVGKSSFIESYLSSHPNEKFAVLAIDPSSQKSGGSILGDKTRMEKLSMRENVFIRPSPAGKTLGGIASKTYETIFLCEHSGFKNILIETVGVGQSETTVSQMVDIMVLLLLPGAGDEIQGIKRGIVELADIVVATKNDGDRIETVKSTMKSYRQALHLLKPKYSNWKVPVLSTSIYNQKSFESFDNEINKFFLWFNDKKSSIRLEQDLEWLERSVKSAIWNYYRNNNQFQQIKSKLEKQILERQISSIEAIRKMNTELEDKFL